MIGWSVASVPEWYGAVYNIAFAVARRDFRFTSADAEDVAQEMALRALRQTRDSEINRAWVHRGATYLCIDIRRTRESERRALDRLMADPTLRTPRVELDPDVRLAIARLSPACRHLIHSYFREGRTWQEIDALLRCGRRCSQYATGKCVEELRRMLAAKDALSS